MNKKNYCINPSNLNINKNNEYNKNVPLNILDVNMKNMKKSTSAKDNLFVFIKKAFMFGLIICIFQCLFFMSTFSTNDNNKIEKINKYIISRNLIEGGEHLNKSYVQVKENIVDKIENIYENKRKTFITKVKEFFKKISDYIEKEIRQVLTYIKDGKKDTVKSGVTFFNKIIAFFKGLQIFSLPILTTVSAILLYKFKYQLASLLFGFLPFISGIFIMYKIIKVNSEMSK
ncbi:putative exported protein [Plasmodium gaboni]|uniref:Putative exported protein n=1 Tax=Plasmodium gaboni TaxID=647221 RepID=A0A151LWR8_9APIC|nr:putative exported protein [Plasmodium gaboni]KYO03628.1 putative exported protein [Plasmodium gaboni]SOV20755.1 Plasmodium exported protein, unknown function [Plasmodium sp. DRC-Itaito]